MIDDTSAQASTALAARYRRVRERTVDLVAGLSPEDCQIQSMPDASPAKWHLAHTSWFFETFVLEPAMSAYRPFAPAFRVLFNSYYNTVGAQGSRPARGLVSRPGLDEVRAYRAHVDARILELVAQDGAAGECARVIELGLQHEQQHQELLLTDIKHALCTQPMRPAFRPGVAAPPPEGFTAAPLRWHARGEEVVEIGHDGRGFAFDNELPRHRVLVPAAALASRLVTCGEYLEFMRDGGYARPDCWLSAGWDAVRAGGWQAPLYWDERDGEWWMATLGGERRVHDAESVCHVSFFEADAFARWAGARLPTEFEWERVAKDEAVAGTFAEAGRLHPRAALSSDGEDAGATDHPAQLFGDVWEWTASPYVGYPGYRPNPGALGEYNGKFMSDQWVLRGGSCATPGDHIRATYRNFFPATARWQFSGIRLARDAEQ